MRRLRGRADLIPGPAFRIEAPNALDRLTYDVDENRIDGFSEDDFVRSQSAAVDGAPELWAVPASAGEFPIEAARFNGLDLRGYQQMRLVLNVGGQAGLTGTILSYRYSLDGGATWYDTDAAIQLDGSTVVELVDWFVLDICGVIKRRRRACCPAR